MKVKCKTCNDKGYVNIIVSHEGMDGKMDCLDCNNPLLKPDGVFVKAPMNSADKLWELKKLEYRKDIVKRECDTVGSKISLEMVEERHDVEMNNIGKEYCDWQKLDYDKCYKNHKEEADLWARELKEINAQISKLLEDE